jgi:hypothetical protein
MTAILSRDPKNIT